MFEPVTDSSELVLFWEEGSIGKVMVYSDFQACLDGYVGMTAYARKTLRAAYVGLDDQLSIRTLVMFLIGFDDEGFPERSWNLPLRHMAEIAGFGPDFGGGHIRLVCRSQCPISWQTDRLWDPALAPGANEFEQVRDAVRGAAQRLGLRAAARVVPPPVMQGSFMMTVGSGNNDDVPVLDVPVLDEPVLQSRPAPVSPSSVAVPEPAAPAVDLSPRLMQLEAERDHLVRELAELRVRLRTLENEKDETLAQHDYVHEQQLAILEAQNAKLLNQHKAVKSQNDALKEQLEALKGQLVNMTTLHENMLYDTRIKYEREMDELSRKYQQALEAKVGEETQKLLSHIQQRENDMASREEAIARQYQNNLEQRLSEEAGKHAEALHALEQELLDRDDIISAISSQLTELRSSAQHMETASAEKFLSRLEKLGMNFLAFHPGAGHISVPVNELARYMENPVGYAAAKCFVTEDQYRQWLVHYENPRCQAVVGEGKCCDARIIRVDSPSKFTVGETDRCARHHSDKNIDAVLKFR